MEGKRKIMESFHVDDDAPIKKKKLELPPGTEIDLPEELIPVVEVVQGTLREYFIDDDGHEWEEETIIDIPVEMLCAMSGKRKE